MKRVFIVFFLWNYFIPFAFSQNVDHISGDNYLGGHFLKRVEYNLISRGFGSFPSIYNLKSKNDVEKLFFGDFNAPVEFFYNPSSEVEPCIPSGCRIVRDSLNISCILEVKYITNYREASKEAYEKAKENRNRHLIDLPAKVLDSLPRDVFNRIWDYNSKQTVSMYYEKSIRFNVDIRSFPVSDQFAEKLYKKMVSFICNFKAKGVPPTILDGYLVTFRTVVEDEVWSLNIHIPQGNALKMADLCREIITDAKADKLNEQKYMTILDTLDSYEGISNKQ